MSGPRFLRLRTVHDAVLVPRPVLGDKSAGAGVLRRTETGLVRVPGTGVQRRGRQYVEPPPTTGVVPIRHLDAAVYGGFVYAHYGHFLLESVGRLWFEGVDDSLPVVWIAATTDRFAPWMIDMLDLLEVGADRIVLHGDAGALEVGELLVADQGFEVHRYLHPWMLERLGRRDAEPDPGECRLWLSRSALGELAGVDDEPEIEARLQREGWTVVHLESLPLSQQVDLLSRASHVAGIEGSALHTLLFVRDFRGTIDILTRHDNPNFEVIARTAGWDQVRHPMPGGRQTEWWRPSGARDVRWSGVDVDAAVETILRSSERRTARPHWWRRWRRWRRPAP